MTPDAVGRTRERATRSAVLVLVLGVVLTAGGALAAWYSFAAFGLRPLPPEAPWVTAAAGWGTIAAGVVALRTRPWSGIGTLLAVIGLLWLARSVLLTPWTIALVPVVERLALAVFAHVFVTFPSGRLTGWQRPAAAAWYGWVVLGSVAGELFRDFRRACPTCPPHVLLVRDDAALREAIGTVVWTGVILGGTGVAAVVARRWWSSSEVRRRQVPPLGTALVPVLVAAVAVPAGADLVGVPELTPRQALYLGNVPLVVLSLLILAELLRNRLAHARVADLVRELAGPMPAGSLEGALADALGDHTLRLAFPRPGSELLLGVDGEPLRRADGAGASAVTAVGADAVVVHDAELDADVVRSAAAAARLSIENERLHAEVRAQLEEIRRSRARLVAAGDAERRRVERDLHDGAQQQLVGLAMTLDRIRARHGSSLGPEVATLVGTAMGEVTAAIAELRRLARGIHPPLLTEQGLGAALESLTDRSELPVDLCTPDRRYPAQVEVAAYFVVAEALTNATKHAGAARVRIDVAEAAGGRLVVEVRDDGRGGADPRGAGLQGLRDRVEAVGGTFDVRSGKGAGTMIRVVLPLHDG